MKSTLVIARRELLEKRFVFIAALAFSALSMIIPLMPGIRAGARGDVLVILSTTFAANFAITLAAILGATIVGRELSERRLSFYFSKPLPAASIWFGKLIAAFLLIVLSAAIIAAPALFAGVEAIVRIWSVPLQTAALVATVLSLPAAVFLITHVIGTFIRSRSAWIILDFVGAAICGVVLSFFGLKLGQGSAFGLIKLLTIIFAVFAAMAIVAAGAWQLASGRTDRKRSHRELSRFLWISIGGGLLVVGGYVAWVVSVKPTDLRPDRLFVRANSGSWSIIGGTANHRGDYVAAFFYNLDDGRAIRIPGVQPWWALLSADTNIAYWTVPSAGVEELWMAKLDSANPKLVKSKITLKEPAFFNFSGDGSRVVSIGRDGMLTVYDVASGASLGSARMPAGNYWLGYFAGPNVVRIYVHWRGAARSVPVFEFDVARKVIAATGELPLGAFRFNREHTLALIRDRNGFEIRDGRTGSLLHSVAGHFTIAQFLRDGRIAAIEHNAGLRLFSPEGAALKSIGVPRSANSIFDVGEGRLVVGAWPWSTAVIDIDRGAIVRVERGLRPVLFGNGGSRLLCYSGAGIIVWNPATGEKRVIAGRS